MSWMRFLILPKGSSPYLTMAWMREARCSSALERCFFARSFTIATRFCACSRAAAERDDDTCSRAGASSSFFLSSPETLLRTLRASTMTSSSSFLAAELTSWSAPAERQVPVSVSSSLLASFSSFTVLPSSPSAEALPSPAAALFAFSSDMSPLSAASWSVSDCLSSSKLLRASVSAFRLSPSCVSAFSFMSSRVFTMPPLCDLCAAAAGAPSSSSSFCEVC
mmetsp:Transcript_54272/g.159650  ORF Transcript_54272/g.159650 Transcript_54272/m.159650 type:complete len:222 (-) Transcript_54272:431-1096(-)